jgi:hypothetical protein
MKAIAKSRRAQARMVIFLDIVAFRSIGQGEGLFRHLNVRWPFTSVRALRQRRMSNITVSDPL